MPGCNGRDRGSSFAPPERGAHFLCRCDWTNTIKKTLTEAQFTMGNSVVSCYYKRPPVPSSDGMGPYVVETSRWAGCVSLPACSAVPGHRVPVAFVMLEPYAVKVARTVLRGEGGREAPDLPGD